MEHEKQEPDLYGWPTWETWHVAVDIDNAEDFYLEKVRVANRGQGWHALKVLLREKYGYTQTYEGVSFRNRKLDLDVLDQWVRDEREVPPSII